MATQQYYIYIMSRTSCISMRCCPFCTRPTRWVWLL